MSDAAPPVRYHLAPPQGWLNDPNGMVRHDGRWHVFYQHNPDAPVHDRIGWGHASSTDLLTWRHHPMAFGPTPGGPDAHGCWSGTFLADAGAPAVVYSGIADESLRSTVCLRWGSPDLESWGEPVVVASTPVDDGIRVMRDPFVFSWSGRRYAVLGAGLDDGVPAVLLFDCEDPLAWRYLGVWATGRDAGLEGMPAADIWECPQVLDLAGGCLLVLSLQLGGVLGDVVAAVGGLVDEGGRPAFVPRSVEALDLGSSFYAPQALVDGPAPLVFGWVREEDLAPGSRDVAGCLTLPRRISLDDGAVRITLDPAVRMMVGPGEWLGPGRHQLPSHCMVVVGPGGAGIRLGPEARAAAPLREGSEVWVDADVVEVYPVGGSSPATVRADSATWWLEVGQGGEAVVHDVALPIPR